MMINKLFEQEVRRVVGGDQEYNALRKKNSYRQALVDFNTRIKPSFRGRHDAVNYVAFHRAGLEDNTAEGLEANSLALTG